METRLGLVASYADIALAHGGVIMSEISTNRRVWTGMQSRGATCNHYDHWSL